MKRYRLFYPKFYSLLIFAFGFLFIISIIHTNNNRFDQSFSYDKPLDLLKKQKVLVPVSINRLYDYRVICPGKNGFLNQTDLVKELSKTCQLSLTGKFKVNLNPPNDFQIRSSITSKYAKFWETKTECSLYREETTAIIISYRDREKNLQNLLFNLIPLLQRQKIRNYKIFIIEQHAAGAFNKGRLYNIAFSHIMKAYNPTCVIFHDADLIPENDQNLYSCLRVTDHPLHMTANVRFHLNGTYTKIYPFLIGGVLTMRPKTFRLLNGYSNRYFNWGGEDDDMGLRFLSKDICAQRPTNGYYYARAHSQQKRNKNRFNLLFDTVLRQDLDGLTDIDQLAVITHVYEYPLVTWMTVNWTNESSLS